MLSRPETEWNLKAGTIVWSSWPEHDVAGGENFKRATRAAIKAYERSGRMIDAALTYAEHGIPVFPVTVDTKAPVARRLETTAGVPIDGTGGFKAATTYPSQIRAWWRGRRHLIGVPMGHRIGTWALDVDSKEGHDVDGIVAWKALQAEHGAVKTRGHCTASNGLHEFFEWTAANPIGCSTGSLPPGIETKAEGGYVVAPPSRRKGKAYVVSRDSKPAAAPDWLYRIIGRRPGIPDAVDGEEGDAPARPHSVWHNTDPTADPDELADAMRYIPNVGDWNTWTAYALALFAATGGSERGFAIFDAWSRTSPKYHVGKTRARWQGIRGSPPSRTGASKIFNAAIANGWKTAPTHKPPKFDAAAAARGKIRREVRRFLGLDITNVFQAFGFRNRGAIAQAIRIDTGLGKTQTAVEEIAKTDKKVIYAVPTHRLGDGIEKLFAAQGVTAAVFRGRASDDPDNPGAKMCLNLAAVEVALKAHADVNRTCCKYKKQRCQFFDQCSYQRQLKGRPQVWIIASDLIFHSQAALGKPDALIIDESFWQQSLRGIDHDEKEQWTIPFASHVNGPKGRRGLGDQLALQPDDGGVQRRYTAGMTSGALTRLIREEWAHMPKLDMHPGMSAAELKRVATGKTMERILHARRCIRHLEELRRMVSDPNIETSGRLLLDHANGQRVIRWRGVAEISKQFQVPTLLLDATLPALEVLQVLHPTVMVAADIRVAMPNCVRIRQITGAPTSASKLNNEKHLEEVRRHILQRWFETGRGKTLVVAQMKVAAWLKGKLPSNIALAHYNAIAGLDQYKDVRLLILAGRVQPGPDAIEALAATLSGQMPESVANGKQFNWYKRVRRGIRLKDGSGVAVIGDEHPDPFCEGVRQLVTEGELVQALGRARGVNRTDETPLDIDLLFDVVLPIEVDEVMNWKRPSLYIATAAEGVMLEAPIDMVKLWPTLWPNEKAADRTVKTGIPNLTGFTLVTYQLEDAKKKRRNGHFDTNLIPDPRAWLEGRLGPLRILT